MKTARSKTLYSLVCFALLAFVFPTNSRAREVLVLLSTSNELFEQVSSTVSDNTTARVDVLTLEERDRAEEAVAALSAAQGDALVAVGRSAWELAEPRSRILPRVYCTYGDLVKEGISDDGNTLVLDLATPLSQYSSLLDRHLSSAKKVAVLHKGSLKNWSSVGVLDGKRVKSFHIASWRRLKKVTKNAIDWADVIWIPTDPQFTSTALAFVIKEALRSKKPLLASSPRIVRGGALAGLIRKPSAVGLSALAWLEAGTPLDFEIPEAKVQVNDKVARFLRLNLGD